MQESSWIRRMFEEGIELRRIHGADKVFDLSLGNPILEPPPEFRTELMRIAQDETPGTHRYMPNGGFPETREPPWRRNCRKRRACRSPERTC